MPPCRNGRAMPIDEAIEGDMARNAPPTIAPGMLPIPPRTAAAMMFTAKASENGSGLM